MTNINTCRRCKISVVKASKALLNRSLHIKEIDYNIPNAAPAVLVDCLKCTNCGHSWIPKQN